MTPFEFVLIFFIGGLILSPVIGDDRSITNAFCIIMTVGVLHFLFAWCRQRSPAFGRIVDGTPLVIFEKGKRRSDTAAKMSIQDDDVMAAARECGLERLDQIKYAILERNGEISIIPVSEEK
jgi:uncharacterized membrane protein YcaP (DUF421 family)